MSAAAQKIVVVGASGYIGKATIAHLAKRTDPKNVTVVTRNPDSAAGEEFKKHGVHVVAGDLGTPASLAGPFTGATSVYVIVPGSENRTELAINGINAAKAARVGHLTLQSIPTAEVVSTLFGTQSYPIEKAAKESGLPWTIVRLPIFVDNIWGQAETVKSIGKFFGAASGDAPHSEVTTDNAGEAAATILVAPAAHTGHIYTISSPHFTYNDLAAALSASTGKTVEYVQLPYDAVKASFIEKGWPAWQVGGLLELFRAVDAGAYGFGLGDYTAITGKEPTTVAQFVEAVKGGFL